MEQSIKDAIAREIKAARDIGDRAMASSRGLSGEEQAEIKARYKNIRELYEQSEGQDSLRNQLAEFSDGIGFNAEPAQKSGSNQPGNFYVPQGSLGNQFVNSAEYKSLISGAPSGRFGDNVRVQSQPMGIKSLLTKQGGGGGGLGGGDDLVSSEASSAGSLVTPMQVPGIDAAYARPLTIRSLVTTGQTGTDSIDYVRVIDTHNAAAPVPEAKKTGPLGDGTNGTVTDVEGGLKPRSAQLFTKETAPVRTIAHWEPATKRSLADAPQVRTIIDGFLRYGIEEALETQMLTGDGSDENFTGLDNVSGIGSQDAPGTGETLMDVLRKSRTQVEIGGRTKATGYVLNPADWERAELLKDGNDRYQGAGPWGTNPDRLWGLPVVTSEAVDEGTAWCADWKKAVLWDREQASIQVTDSHADFFIRNLVAILAEGRYGFGVIRPAAFVKVDLGTGGGYGG